MKKFLDDKQVILSGREFADILVTIAEYAADDLVDEVNERLHKYYENYGVEINALCEES